MKNSQMENIRKRVESLPFGSAFVVSDFTDACDYQNAKKCLLRLEKEGFLRRVIRGIYDRPYFSKVLGEYSAPDIEEVAKAIARNYAWSIAPIGLTALNLLGLSTQVNAHYEYYSNGPYKTYDIDGMEIRFLHRSSRETEGLSYLSAAVISAIKMCGKSIDDIDLQRIGRRIGPQGKKRLLEESQHTTKWIYELVKKICT